LGILQAAYRTYRAYEHLVGKIEEGKEPLTPISHIIQNAHIEIVINADGEFQKAYPVPKDQSKTIIPVSVKSASRTSNVGAHPLCDQLCYISPRDKRKHVSYITQLARWANSEFSHPKVVAVLKYIQKGTILTDLAASGVITLDESGNLGSGKIEGTDYNKCLVRWQVIPAPEGVSSACWEDATLFQSYISYYESQLASEERDYCYITGLLDTVCDTHPKGVVVKDNSAKLISANDNTNFTYRGRFTEPKQAYNIGYTASQMSHYALRWITSKDGVIIGNRTFICWNPEGAQVPKFAFLGMPGEEPADYVGYKRQLSATLGGYRQALKPTSDVVIAAFDAATTGRLSLTYYNELKASDFLDRIEDWYSTLCWDTYYGVQSPSLRRIVECAFGTQRDKFIETDEKILSERFQQLLRCMVDKQPLSYDIVRALVTRAGIPLAYNPKNRETLLTTACAVVRKYRNDKLQKEEWKLTLDASNRDRSYLFGRLLAIAEQVERSTYDREEGREPNAIRMWSVFAQRPLYGWRILEEKLIPYYARLTPGLRAYFKNLTSEIVEMLPDASDSELGRKLEDTYLLGYYHQRSAMTRKKQRVEKEEAEDESVEE
jgi:CRISPR-associated protein Csd1